MYQKITQVVYSTENMNQKLLHTMPISITLLAVLLNCTKSILNIVHLKEKVTPST